MIIIEKNQGAKIPYAVNGTTVVFDDDLSINLAKREQDWPVHIDVCYDVNKTLVIGAAAGRKYVAELDIPARVYTETETAVDEDEGGGREAVALDMDTVTLTLWAVRKEAV